MSDLPNIPCIRCGGTISKVGEAMTDKKSIPLYGCELCANSGIMNVGNCLGELAYHLRVAESGKVKGIIYLGQAYRLERNEDLTPEREDFLVPVAHPDDVWG